MTASITAPSRVRHLHRPRRGQLSAGAPQVPAPLPADPAATPSPQRNWPVLLFMVAIHVLAAVALLPRFWSLPAVASLLILYWVTACLGVTVGYHRLLSHRAFQVPRWLERFFATYADPRYDLWRDGTSKAPRLTR